MERPLLQIGKQTQDKANCSGELARKMQSWGLNPLVNPSRAHCLEENFSEAGYSSIRNDNNEGKEERRLLGYQRHSTRDKKFTRHLECHRYTSIFHFQVTTQKWITLSIWWVATSILKHQTTKYRYKVQVCTACRKDYYCFIKLLFGLYVFLHVYWVRITIKKFECQPN